MFWKFLQWLAWSRNKGQGLNYHIKVASQKFLSEIKLPIFIFFSTVLRRISDVYKHFGFAKVKVHFAFYDVQNDNSNPKGQNLKWKRKTACKYFFKMHLKIFWKIMYYSLAFWESVSC